MRRSNLSLILAVGGLAFSLSAVAANWKECNGTPVRPKYQPMGIFWDLCSLPDGSAGQRAFLSALYEVRNYVSGLGFGSGYRRIHNGVCLIEHDNGRSDAALVKRADIDGALGLTVIEDDGCTFSWEEMHIITADVMASDDLVFSRANEAAVIRTAPAGTVIGALVMLHEVGHAAGLEHTNAFAVMRDGLGARAPFVGMTPNSGGLSSELTGDDAFGLMKIYGFDSKYRNLFVSSQALRAGGLIDNNIDPTNNDLVWSDPLLVCPGNVVNFVATIGNNSTTRESFRVAVYADADINAYPGSTSPALSTFNASMGQGVFTLPVNFTVPASLPANTTLNIFVSLPDFNPAERKGYDNSARSRLRIRRKAGC